jgi:hypothetical protein
LICLQDPADLLNSFFAMKDKSSTSIFTFLSVNTDFSGNDMLPWTPPDFNELAPSALSGARIVDPRFAEFAQNVHAIWYTQ